LSDAGYGDENALWTLPGLIAGGWQSDSIYVTLGGGSEGGMTLAGQDAWLDNFAVDEGTIVP
jgi:hypothetical protein